MSNFNVKYLLLLFVTFYGLDAFSQSVSISPASFSKACGVAVTSKTFTATPSNFTGTVYYSWSAGTNGYWKYNGTPVTAPVSTGTSASITLTADACASSPSNVTVTAANGTKTATATASVTQPAFLLNGPSAICDGSSATYSIGNLSCSSTTYSWSVSPTGYTTPTSGTGSTFTISKSGSTNGPVTVKAILTNACSSSPVTLTKSVAAGVDVQPLTGTYSTSCCTNPLYTVNQNIPVGNVYVQYQWPGISNPVATLAPGSPSGTGFYAFSGGFSFNIASQQQIGVYITGTNACGQQMATRSFLQSGSFRIVASPNPARDYINVKITPQPVTNKTPVPAAGGETIISLYNSRTGFLVQQWKFSETTITDYNLKLFSTKAGMYDLRVERNGQSVAAKIMVGEK